MVISQQLQYKPTISGGVEIYIDHKHWVYAVLCWIMDAHADLSL